mmetsp:Transcript_508/g.799  ORF Transcript_508/g.799 Transcript_508/m.799 type:complete len:128 (-) Transcript_508:273-656(-)
MNFSVKSSMKRVNCSTKQHFKHLTCSMKRCPKPSVKRERHGHRGHQAAQAPTNHLKRFRIQLLQMHFHGLVPSNSRVYHGEICQVSDQALGALRALRPWVLLRKEALHGLMQSNQSKQPKQSKQFLN